ncbi:cytochrome b [Pseudomonas sp. FP198]|jgi:cytochrome b561|uniref:cytochrome b n=1 Tax=Pseudomonas sp. FP198 TaxID=2954084 RepID=UPI0027341D8E|nr:cytochrome b/b6 domain-containing protein [Pseudomonas sp. FP198]WLG95430.1 cytochrome b/b6 domain-containing protein [Pseudomonas sp. FP198]
MKTRTLKGSTIAGFDSSLPLFPECLQESPPSYSKPRVLLHWISAFIILWTLASGFYVAYVPVPVFIKQWIGSLNVSLTTVLIPLFAWRLWLFFSNLEIRTAASSMNKSLALAVHAVIYLVTSVVLASGVLMMTTPISLFGLVQIPQPLDDVQLNDLALTFHILSCMTLALLVALHICAVVWHESSGRRVLRRMTFRKSVGVLIQ